MNYLDEYKREILFSLDEEKYIEKIRNVYTFILF